MSINREDALNYHMQGRPGKIEVVPTKTLSTQCRLGWAAPRPGRGSESRPGRPPAGSR